MWSASNVGWQQWSPSKISLVKYLCPAGNMCHSAKLGACVPLMVLATLSGKHFTNEEAEASRAQLAVQSLTARSAKILVLPSLPPHFSPLKGFTWGMSVHVSEMTSNLKHRWMLLKIIFWPWLVRLSGLNAILQTKGSPVQFPVRARAWVVGQVSQ